MSGGDSHEDFLTEDAEIPGQKFVLLSFLSPEKVLADKNIFMLNRFLQGYEYTIRAKNLESFLMKTAADINEKLESEAVKAETADLSGVADTIRTSKIRIDGLMDRLQDYIKKDQKDLNESKLKESYDDFLYANKAKLEDDFYAKNEFRTTVRGLKVRGVYSSQGEAVARSKKLQRLDPIHNIFVGEIGKWLPWDPEPSDVAEQEYAEEQLNTLMKKYKENEEARESFQREMRSKATGSKKVGMSISREEGAESAPVTDAGAAATSQFSSMFGEGGPADLAIARKMGGDGSGSGSA
jgi:hypothetical protein